jgi:tripartite-type tricarboxylate transporter receptor subunit TctC
MMTLTRLLSATAAALTLTATPVAFAQSFPGKPLTVIVPYAVGGTTDIVARLVTSQIGTGSGSRSSSTTAPAAAA